MKNAVGGPRARWVAAMTVAFMATLPGAPWVQVARAQATAPASVPDNEEIFQIVRDVVAFGIRMPGTPASVQTTQYVHGQFAAAGLERVGYEPAVSKVWRAWRWGLNVGGAEIPCVPMQHTFHDGKPAPFSTGPQGLQAQVVYAGKGNVLDFAIRNVKGKVVVIDVPFGSLSTALLRPFALGIQDSANTFPLDYKLTNPYSGGSFPFSYYRAMRAGAAAVIGVLVDDVEGSRYYNEAYGSYDPGLEMKVPGLWLSPARGKLLVDAIKKAGNKPLMATVRLDGELAAEPARAVYGYLPGMSDEVILIQSHHDSSTAGAVEDASGTAEVIALARYYGKLPRSQRPRTLMFATMETHFTDYAVHKAFANRYLRPGNPTGQKTVLGITIEHIGLEYLRNAAGVFAPTGLSVPKSMFVSTEVKGLGDIAVAALKKNALERTFAAPTTLVSLVTAAGVGLPADSSDFLRVGLPLVVLVGGPMYLYDAGDTLEKVDKDNLSRVASMFVDIIDGASALPSANFKTLKVNADF